MLTSYCGVDSEFDLLFVLTKTTYYDDITCHWKWSKTTLNYWMMVERSPNLKEEVGGSIPGCEYSSLLDKFLPSGRLPLVLWR